MAKKQDNHGEQVSEPVNPNGVIARSISTEMR